VAVSVDFLESGGNEFAIGRLGVGSDHVCAVTSFPGGLWCWGDNSRGQLGTGSAGGQSDAPVQVDVSELDDLDPAPPLDWRWIAAGESHTCAVEKDDDDASGLLAPGLSGYYCWGANDDGRLGDGTTTDRDSPARVVQGH
ncbi:MAG: hypothetical protein ACODAA_08525, partial [Gemmatimonadota bacterium]